MRLFLRFPRDFRRICRITEQCNRQVELLPAEFVELVLVLEDRKFEGHLGVDFFACLRAAFHVLRGRPKGGASTIAMQFARTVTGYRARTLTRKLYEALLAVALSRRFQRYDILFAYLSLAYFGHGAGGYQAASQRFFGRSIAELNLEQKAEMAALLLYPMPIRLSDTWREKVRRRARYGLARRRPNRTDAPWLFPKSFMADYEPQDPQREQDHWHGKQPDESLTRATTSLPLAIETQMLA